MWILMWLGIIFLFAILFAIPTAWVLWLWIGKRRIRPQRMAILATAIPPILPATAVVVLGLLGIHGSYPAQICVLVSLGLGAAAFLSSFVFAIMRKWEIAKSTGFGGGIGLVAFV